MASKNPLDKYVAAGKEFTEKTRKQVQTIASDLARESESGRGHAEDWADDSSSAAVGVPSNSPSSSGSRSVSRSIS